MVDTYVSGAYGEICVGSSPISDTIKQIRGQSLICFIVRMGMYANTFLGFRASELMARYRTNDTQSFVRGNWRQNGRAIACGNRRPVKREQARQVPPSTPFNNKIWKILEKH